MRMPSAKTTGLVALIAGLLMLLACGPVAGAATPAPAKKKVAKQRPTYWGAWIGTQLTGGQPPWDMTSVARFQELTGKSPSLLSFSAPFADCTQHPCSYYDFPAYEMDVLRSYGAIPFFSWGTQAIPVPGDLNQPDFQLTDIINGDFDPYIRKWAEEARDWGHPFFLRFNWEMNGDWFLWSEGVNGNPPGTYVAAWRHVHDIFKAVGATNATWTWCPYADVTHKFGALAKYYPGDDAVDWTCLDGFNWAKNGVNNQPWRSFDELFASSYRTITKRVAPSKPMLLAEFASGGSGKRKAAWIDQMFKDLRTKYRRIRGLLWFEQIDRGVTWPIESSPKATAAFRRGIRPGAFRINQFGSLTGGPVQPPS